MALAGLCTSVRESRQCVDAEMLSFDLALVLIFFFVWLTVHRLLQNTIKCTYYKVALLDDSCGLIRAKGEVNDTGAGSVPSQLRSDLNLIVSSGNWEYCAKWKRD